MSLDRLVARLEQGDVPDRAELLRALEALRTSLEELRTAEAQLLEQNDAIAAAHVALSAERQRYRELFDLAPDAYLVTDEEGLILDANRSAGTLFGIAHEFLVGKPLASYVPVDRRREFRTLVRSAAEIETPAQLDLRLQRRTGVPLDAAVTVAVERRPHTDVAIGLRWLIRDVSEQRQAEKRLWELNAELEHRVAVRTAAAAADAVLLEAVIEQVPLGIVIVDAPSGAIRVANTKARESFLAGPKPVDSLAAFAQVPVFRLDGTPYGVDDLPLSRALEAGETVLGELLCREVDGHRATIAVTAFPVRDDTGSTIAAVTVMEDVSARERRQQAEREFAANASHELRTPVAAIASAIEVLQAGAKDDVEERDRFLDHIERESARLQRLTRALLLLARADAAGERPRVAVVPLRPLLTDVAAGITAAPGVKLSIRCRRDLAVVAAPDLLEQAVANVLGNAVRYTEAGSITVAARADGEWAAIDVVDTGRGMDRGEAELVFGRFYRAGPRDALGVGLGLAIARQAIEACGGTIVLTSGSGAGTTVTIRVPAARLVRR